MDTETEFPWHIGVYDAHCHPTDTMGSLNSISTMRAQVLTIMATRFEDQELVNETAMQTAFDENDQHNTTTVIPSFGFHPWFSYQIFDDADFNTKELNSTQYLEHYKSVLRPPPDDEAFLASLPPPVSLANYIDRQRKYLEQHPLALVGEVGIDKAFRLPEAWADGEKESRDQTLTLGGRDGRRLSPYSVEVPHQLKILTAQLRLAGKLQRPASVHGVQSHGVLLHAFQALWAGHELEPLSNRQRKQIGIKRPGILDDSDDSDDSDSRPDQSGQGPFPPRICLHSYSGNAQAILPYFAATVPCKVFVSFSTVINFSTPGAAKAEEVIRWLPEDRILIESDLHTAGTEIDQRLEDIARRICHVKQWQLDYGVNRLAKNWKHFVLGHE
jgi:Tat protein secretion system quality control protein TatD with DNase activity